MKFSEFCFVFLLQFIKFPESVKSLPVGNTTDKQILIVISYDGFRNEYFERNVTKNMLEFRENGVYADYMKNVFPTKTFTNHYSIATGYYPEKHGILANSLYDMEQGFLKYGEKLFHYDETILPIWIVNQRMNGSSGCMMWPGSNMVYGNDTCKFVEKYNASVPLRLRVDTVITWLTEPDPPNLIMFYSEQPDKLAHMVGPDSPNVTDMVAELDKLTKYFQDQLIENNLINRTNVIHLSDHGMVGVKPPKFINLTNYVDKDTADYYGTSPVLQVVPRNLDNLTTIHEILKNAAKTNGNFKVYTNDDVLDRWHSKNRRRFGPLVVVANDGYAFQDMYMLARVYEKNFSIEFTDQSDYGVHGYDNDYKSMHAYFMAKGPKFQSQTKIDPFNSVDLFILFSKLLGFEDHQLDARQGQLKNVEKTLKDYSSTLLNWTNIIIAACLCAIIIAVVIMYIVHQYRKRQNYTVTY